MAETSGYMVKYNLYTGYYQRVVNFLNRKYEVWAFPELLEVHINPTRAIILGFFGCACD